MSHPSPITVFCRRFAHVLLAVAIAAVLLIAALGAADSAGSVLFDRPIPATLEITELFVAVIIFMTQPYVVLRWSHISVDLFRFERGSILRTLRIYLTLALSLLSYAVIAVGAWRSMTKSLRLGELSGGIVSIPVYPFKIGLFVGACATILVIVLMFLVRHDDDEIDRGGEM